MFRRQAHFVVNAGRLTATVAIVVFGAAVTGTAFGTVPFVDRIDPTGNKSCTQPMVCQLTISSQDQPLDASRVREKADVRIGHHSRRSMQTSQDTDSFDCSR